MLLYGLRTFTEQPSFRAVAVGPALLWDYTQAICTYLLIPVVFVFVEHFLGPGWRSSIRRVWQVHLVYAVTAITIDIGTGTPLATVGLNNVLVVVWMVVVLANLAGGAFRIDREIRIVRVGLGVLVILIIHDNLAGGGLGLLPWSFRMEPVGAVIMVGCLGYALALRTFGNERRLATLDHELRTARRIQRSLLPAELPPPPGGGARRPVHPNGCSRGRPVRLYADQRPPPGPPGGRRGGAWHPSSPNRVDGKNGGGGAEPCGRQAG